MVADAEGSLNHLADLQVVTSMDRAVRVLDACAKHGKLQAAADAAQMAASFTNVAIELHTALRAFADQNMISDAMLEKQLDVTLTELAKLQQPEYGASAQTMARLRACCEQMRVDELSHTTSHDLRGRETSPVDLQSALLEIVDGCAALAVWHRHCTFSPTLMPIPDAANMRQMYIRGCVAAREMLASSM